MTSAWPESACAVRDRQHAAAVVSRRAAVVALGSMVVLAVPVLYVAFRTGYHTGI